MRLSIHSPRGSLVLTTVGIVVVAFSYTVRLSSLFVSDGRFEKGQEPTKANVPDSAELDGECIYSRSVRLGYLGR
jgi:hypothetical protein